MFIFYMCKDGLTKLDLNSFTLVIKYMLVEDTCVSIWITFASL